MKIILEKLYQGKKINYQQSQQLFTNIIQGKLAPEQISAILVSMKIHGEYIEEITGAANTLLNNSKKFLKPNYLFADITGTGGDYSNTINISTASAIVAAGCGAKIAKHGNKKISSNLGSADVLSSLGVKLNITPEKSRNMLDLLGICFLFAPYYYYSFKYISPIRNILKTKTLFNILGPLINPSRPPLALIGVYNKNIMLLIAKILHILGYKHAILVNSNGIDEVTLHSNTDVVELYYGDVEKYLISAKNFGLSKQSIKKIINISPEKKKSLFIQVLSGKGEYANITTIAANVALLLKLFGKKNLKENTECALEEIYSGNPYKRLLKIISQQ